LRSTACGVREVAFHKFCELEIKATMIHQMIFTNPKPGMTDEEFFRYWIEVHAVNYASKIPQIRLYKVDTRVAVEGIKQPAPFTGVAEIWLENEQEQVASLQTPEFLLGARADEPNWAAFWTTLVLDTTAHLVLAGPAETRPAQGVKLLTLWKRKTGMELDDFRTYLLQSHAPLALELPGLRRYLVNLVRDSYYAVGEARFDAVTQMWFDDAAALASSLSSAIRRETVEPDEVRFAEARYTLALAVKENWIIGPEVRASVL
jgi:uncharacterized protein (TIGR02118 family)